jgi:lysophospholipase L1-like esterase
MKPICKRPRPRADRWAGPWLAAWLFLLAVPPGCSAQDPYVAFEQPVAYGFEQREHNVVFGAVHLDPVFEKMYRQKTGGQQIVRILHIGDSHVQADHFPGVVRENLQLRFGNAGRGLVVPFRVAKTNEPHSYRTECVADWQSQRCSRPPHLLPVGIGGLTVRGASAGASLTLRTIDHPQLDYAFEKLLVFFQQDRHSFDLAVLDSAGREMARVDALPDGEAPHYAVVHLDRPVHSVTLRAVSSRPGEQNHLTIFGLSAENGRPGILYHTVGINGARGEHFAQSEFFARQTAALEPDLIVLSLGTNEGQDPRLTPQAMGAQTLKLVEALKRYNPGAVFLFTTPPNTYARRTRTNPAIAVAAEGLAQLARAEGAAYWDLNKVGGSAANWRGHGLLSDDGVHFTVAGYQLHGHLFCEAFFNAYNSYVSNRR